MLFFTDITTDASKYCMLNIKRYGDPRKRKKKMVFVDPGVYELKKSNEYSEIDRLHKIAQNPQLFEWISIDYPCDMRPNDPEIAELFVQKSIENNWRYKD